MGESRIEPGGSWVVIDNRLGILGVETPMVGLAGGGVYKAWVRGLATDGTSSAWSDAYFFNVASSVSAVIQTPAYDSTITNSNPAITWSTDSNAVSYEVSVSCGNAPILAKTECPAIPTQ